MRRLAALSSLCCLPSSVALAFLDRKYDQPGFDLERFAREAPNLGRKADLPRLRSLRRERAARVSNEAWAELQFLTGLMQYAKTAAQ